MTTKSDATHYPTFDYLRLVLALEVAVNHYYDIALGIGHVPSWVRFCSVFVSVPSFLAISGFMILQSWRSSATPGEFWVKRVTRILPAFFSSLVLVGLLFGPREIGRALQTWGTFGFRQSVNYPLWSLSCEEVIYILLAVACLCGLVCRRSIAIATALTTLAFMAYRISHRPTMVDHFALPMCFCWGLFAREYGYRIRHGALIFTALLIVSGYLCRVLQYSWAYPFMVLFSCLSVLDLGRSNLRLPRLRVDYSYGLYIYHLPIVTYLIARHFPVWSIVLSIAAVVAFSAHIIEQPVMRLRKRLTTRPAPTSDHTSTGRQLAEKPLLTPSTHPSEA